MNDSDLGARVLRALEGGDAVTCREIADALDVSRRAVSLLLHTELRHAVVRDALFCWRLRDVDDGPAVFPEEVGGSPRSFVSTFLERRGLVTPDGRELYKYRCSETEFEAMHLAISDLIDSDPFGRSAALFAPIFVLYAAEWWRRHQGTGPWSWDPVFESLELKVGNIMSIYPAVIAGLKAWKRPILRSQHGRMFLVTLACEGGLPLQVLKTEGARLRGFFRQVLEDFALHSRSGVSASELARRNEQHLPRSLRQEIVFELGGQLVESIWALQSRVRGAKDPVAELDTLEPEWREQLPFEVDDGVASAFLNSLVQTAHRIRQGATDEFRFNRSLSYDGSWTLRASLSFPPTVDEAWMAAATGLATANLPQRGQFVLTSSSGHKRAAVNVTQRYRGEKVGYVLERLAGAEVDGALAADGWSLQFESNRGAGVRREIRGASTLSTETPWTFTEIDEGRWRFIGQGSVRTRSSDCLVLLPPSASNPGGLPAGELLGRSLRRVDTSLEFSDDEGERFRILLGQKEDQSVLVQVYGDRFDLGADDREVFVGLPVLREMLSDESLRAISPASIEWRPVGTKQWRRWAAECVGRVSVRVLQSGETRFLQTLDILPKGFSARLKGDSATTGTVELESDVPFIVRPEASDELSADVTESARGATVRLGAESARRVPAAVAIELDFGDSRRLSVALPFPARGARFVGRGDRVVPFGGSVSVDELSLCRLEVFATGGSRRFTIDGILNADDLAPTERVGFPFDLPESRNGRIVLDLRRLAPDVRALLSETDDGEAFVSLSVDAVGPNRLEVRRYEVDFEVAREADMATLPSGIAVGDVIAEMIPLWDPATPRDQLVFEPSMAGWRLSLGTRAAGPWLLLGRTRNTLSIRPRLIPVEGEVSSRPPLATAISLDEFASKDAIKAALHAMTERPLDEEWSTVLTIVKLSAELPASSFHVTAALCQDPAASVVVLIHAGADRQLVWDTLANAGLEWRVVPYHAWHDGLSSFRDELARQLAGTMADAEALASREIASVLQFLEESPERSPMEPTWMFLRTHLFELEPAGIVGSNPDAVVPSLQTARSQLVSRQVEARWPNGPRLLGRVDKNTNDAFKALVKKLGASDYRSAVITAPLFSARAAALGEHVGRRLRGELRRLRSFDVEWFDTAYRLALVKYLNHAYPMEVD